MVVHGYEIVARGHGFKKGQGNWLYEEAIQGDDLFGRSSQWTAVGRLSGQQRFAPEVPCCFVWLRLPFVADITTEEINLANEGTSTCRQNDWLPRWPPLVVRLFLEGGCEQSQENLGKCQKFGERRVLQGCQTLDGVRVVRTEKDVGGDKIGGTMKGVQSEGIMCYH